MSSLHFASASEASTGREIGFIFLRQVRTATERDLRNNYSEVLRWVSAGEDVLIIRRGKIIARLSPETDQTAEAVDWASSPEVLRDRSGDDSLTAE